MPQTGFVPYAGQRVDDPAARGQAFFALMDSRRSVRDFSADPVARELIEIAVATLATDRALLLYGVPGTAKSWVSEHLAAAISGDSTLLVQGTAGTPEEAIRYGWNYAQLLAKGPSRDAVVPSPVMRGMTEGKIVRVEELTRVPSDVQDTLITILSEKTLPIPELNSEVRAVKGFNIIATANDRDKGVNGQVKYSIVQQPNQKGTKFSIDEETGEVFTNKAS